MRENKFKFWDKIHQCFNKNSIGYFMNVHGVLTFDIGTRYIPVQFTGLLDKNGKEIYEGDILRTESEVIELRTGNGKGMAISLSEVIWIDYSWGYRHFKDIQNSTGTVPHEVKGLRIKAKYSEVIGNIYEHSNLLDK